MEIDLITVKDLKEFRIELLTELKDLLKLGQQDSPKAWLKGAEIKKLLNLSESKLQKLRIQGTLRSSKIGGAHYYRYSDIEKMFNENLR
jgi:Helix-turn-helix domain